MSDSLPSDLEIARRILRADRMRPPPPTLTPATIYSADLLAPGMVVVSGPACLDVEGHLRDAAQSYGYTFGDWEPLVAGPGKPPLERVVFVSLEAPQGVPRMTLWRELNKLAASLGRTGERKGTAYVVCLPPKFSNAQYADHFKYGSKVRIETITATSAYILVPKSNRYYYTLLDGVWTRDVDPETHVKSVFLYDDLSDVFDP